MTLKLMNSKATYLLALVFLLTVFSLTGCLNDDGDPGPSQLAYVSIYHASPDTYDLDIHVGNYIINTEPFSYGEYTNYVSFHPGDRTIKFTEAGKDQNVLIDTTLTIENLKNYTIFIADSLSNIDALILTDTAEAPGTGKSMIRFVHLSPDAPEVRVMADDEELFPEQSFKGGTAFKEIDAGTLTFDFRSADNEVLLSTPDTHLQAGKYYTMILKGFHNPPAGNNNELSTDIYRN